MQSYISLDRGFGCEITFHRAHDIIVYYLEYIYGLVSLVEQRHTLFIHFENVNPRSALRKRQISYEI